MRKQVLIGALGLLMSAFVAGGSGVTGLGLRAQSNAVDTGDCTKLKGKARRACETKQGAATPADQTGASMGTLTATPKSGAPDRAVDMPTTGVPDPPSASESVASPSAGAARSKSKDASGTGDMPTSGVPDPPSESMEPLGSSSGSATPPDGPGKAAKSGDPSSSSSSSSSSSPSSLGSGGQDDASGDDDAAPTIPGADSPVKSAALKDLGSRADTSGTRAKLEKTRVEDDLKVGGFYFKSGDLPGATARYQDALQHDPDNPDAHFGLAQVLLKQNKREEAVRQLQAYVKLAPDDDHTKEAQKLLAKLGPVQ